MLSLFEVLKRYRAQRGRWDEVCLRCGRCCFEREMGEDGEWLVNYAAPCDFLDLETHLCTVYDRRFEACDRCRPLTLRVALFSKHLPSECAYVQLFRGTQS